MMNKKDMQAAIKRLTFEMTASMSTAEFCMDEMDLDGEDDLWDIARYIEKLVDEDVQVIKQFKVPEYKQLTPEQLEESKKRLQEMIESWKKFEQEYPELAQEMYCDVSDVNWFSFCLEHGRYLGGNCPECKDE